jgi:hypothetical protein
VTNRSLKIPILAVICLVVILVFSLKAMIDSSSSFRNGSYRDSEIDWAPSLVLAEDGGYALAGSTFSVGSGSTQFDFCLMETDANGEVQWRKTYGGSRAEIAHSLVRTSDGGYAIAGYTRSSYFADSSFWLVKADTSGNMVWNRTYGTRNDEALSLIRTRDGGYALSGWGEDPSSDIASFHLVKTDSEGTLEWSRSYGAEQSEIAYSMVQTADGGYALAGSTSEVDRGGSKICLIKTDSSGTLEWSRSYGAEQSEIAYSMVQTADGGYALAGYTYSQTEGKGYRFWLVKTDSTGHMQWNNSYGMSGLDIAYSLVQTSDGGFAIAGFTESASASFEFWLVRTDTVGNMKWSGNYGKSGSEIAHSLVQTADEGFAVAGSTLSSDGKSLDFYLVKTDLDGTVEWERAYAGSNRAILSHSSWIFGVDKVVGSGGASEDYVSLDPNRQTEVTQRDLIIGRLVPQHTSKGAKLHPYQTG